MSSGSRGRFRLTLLGKFRPEDWTEMPGWNMNDKDPTKPGTCLLGPLMLRLTKHRRWKHKYAVLQDATIKLYKSRKVQQEGHTPEVQLNLVFSSIRYCIRKLKFRIKCGEGDEYSLKMHKKQHFDDWVELMRSQRIYRQFITVNPNPHTELTNHANDAKTTESDIKHEMIAKKSSTKEKIASANSRSRSATPTPSIKKVVVIEEDLEGNNDVDVSESSDTSSRSVIIQPTDTIPPRTISKRQYRTSYPSKMCPTQSISFTQIMKGMKSLHVSFFEPLSLLQVVCEEMEHRQFLEMAVQEQNAGKRMSWVVAFCVARYSNTKDRSRKPFNSKLGETFELNRWQEEGWRFHAELVDRKPDVAAAHAEGVSGWVWWQSIELKLSPKLQGFSPVFVAEPKGFTGLELRNFKETYCWNHVQSQIENLMSEDKKVIHFGKMNISCNNGYSVDIKFDKNANGKYAGKIKDPKGSCISQVKGSCFSNCELSQSSSSSPWVIFKPTPRQPNAKFYYSLPDFAMQLNILQEEEKEQLPPTDSRFRKDIRLLEEGKVEEADVMKKTLELENRVRRENGEDAKPIWFSRQSGKDAYWITKGNYWKAKQNNFAGIKFTKLW